MSAGRHVEVGLLEMQVLWLLGKRESHGYALMGELSKIKSSRITQGTLYPVLASLRKKGLVRQVSRGTRGKKVYGLTVLGEKTRKQTCGEFVRAFSGVFYDEFCAACPGHARSSNIPLLLRSK